MYEYGRNRGTCFSESFFILSHRVPILSSRERPQSLKNPEYELDGSFQEGRAASPAATIPIPLPRASLSLLVKKQPGGLGYKLHSKCSKEETTTTSDTSTATLLYGFTSG
jgi:hypothetical protein